jgi:hypothetical protein
MATDETTRPPEPPANNPAPTGPEEYVVVDPYFRNHDPEDLIRYRGNWVAWSRDGCKVLFASPEPEKLCEMIDASGLQPGDYVLSAIEVDW